ncbi:MAG TPA: prolipoprotein diacylglyceryl transferase [Anaerolineae bacterium]|nr:prolipoprotein diacylglyceryl transferase [Anaerolineae bacterium]HOR00738.1 prolipoprotein diacylglyceryl transferase [Anaerolineae bacterium]HPL29067.1 prolipoprotein diacylglyceryl transferase [Anaerolineae bacterium]
MPSRVLLQIGPVAIYWYGVLIVTGTLAAAWIATKQARQAGDDPEHVWNALLLCLVLGVIGARLYHVASMLQHYLAHPGEIFGLQMQGFGIYGAVAGGALGLWIYTHRNSLNFLRWADFAAPGIALAQAIGRWGNFFNQELYGFPTALPWGIYIAPENRLPGFTQYERFHPTFLYESLWNLLSFGILMFLSRKARKRLMNGDLFLLYGILYSLGRFFVEFQRPDAYQLETWKFLGAPMAQWVAIGAILFFGSVLIYRHQRGGGAPVVAEPEESSAEQG